MATYRHPPTPFFIQHPEKGTIQMALQPSWRMLAISAAVSVVLSACGGDDSPAPALRPLPVVPIDSAINYGDDYGDSSIVPVSAPVLFVNGAADGSLKPNARNTVSLQLLTADGTPIPGTRQVRIDLPDGITFPGVGQSGIVTFTDGVTTFDIATSGSCDAITLNLTDLATGTPLQARLQTACGAGDGGNGGGAAPNDGANRLEILVNGSPTGKLTPGQTNTITVRLVDPNGNLVPDNSAVKVDLPNGVTLPDGTTDPTVTLQGGTATITIVPAPFTAGSKVPISATPADTSGSNPNTAGVPAANSNVPVNGGVQCTNMLDCNPDSGNGGGAAPNDGANRLQILVNGSPNGKLKPGEPNEITVQLVDPNGKVVSDNSPVTIDIPNDGTVGTVKLPDGSTKPAKDGDPTVNLQNGKVTITITPDPSTAGKTVPINANPPASGGSSAITGATPGKANPPVDSGGTAPGGNTNKLVVLVNGDPNGKLVPGQENKITVRLVDSNGNTVSDNSPVTIDLPNNKLTGTVKLPDGNTVSPDTDPTVNLENGEVTITITPDLSTAGSSNDMPITANPPASGGSPAITGASQGEANPAVTNPGVPAFTDVNHTACTSGTDCSNTSLLPNNGNLVSFKLTGDVPKSRTVTVKLDGGATFPDGNTTMEVAVDDSGVGSFPIITDDKTASEVLVTITNPDNPSKPAKATIPVPADDGSVKLTCSTNGKATVQLSSSIKQTSTWAVWRALQDGLSGWDSVVLAEDDNAARPAGQKWWQLNDKGKTRPLWTAQANSSEAKILSPGSTVTKPYVDTSTLATIYRVAISVDGRVIPGTQVTLGAEVSKPQDILNCTVTEAAGCVAADYFLDDVFVSPEKEPSGLNTTPVKDDPYIASGLSSATGDWTSGATNYLFWKVSNDGDYHGDNGTGLGKHWNPSSLFIDRVTITADCQQ